MTAAALRTDDRGAAWGGLPGALVTWTAREGFALHRYVVSEFVRHVFRCANGALVVVHPFGAFESPVWTDPPRFEPVDVAMARVGESFALTLAVDGPVATISTTSGAWPRGLTMTGNTLSGTPTEAGRFEATITARDRWGRTDATAVVIDVAEPADDPPPPPFDPAPISTCGCGTSSRAGAWIGFALLGWFGRRRQAALR